ncbi:glycosyltransferase [Kaistella sp. G5-32]|uniref:Glycosyltransferase n=1 Tax=Kaistella gelatinilytica TaxID=2787636 RepID=A0ABS0FC43_9FLAO|nr:glycosyltransferase [Kaistella gelatinilytica]MBF8457265.1 glycosyltransferase [Kaistella gelatinilytica]
MKVLVSIIIPCYNQAQYLDECLKSILDQTYENWECLIINDGSPDHTEKIAKKWVKRDKRFKYLYKENGGTSSAKNFGIKAALGNYIQILDSDDLLEKDKIFAQATYFDNDIDLIISGYRYFESKDGRDAKKIFGRQNFLPEVCLTVQDTDILNLFSVKNPFVISAPIYKKSIFEKVGLFDERLSALEDWELHLRCALHNMKFQHSGYLKNSLCLIRLHENSAMRNNQKMQKSYINFVEICNLNPLYVEKLGFRKLPDQKRLLNYISLFFPPIINVVLNKIKTHVKK